MDKILQKKLNSKLVMTLLARNEEDIIEECIKFHLNHGVDFIIATDNASTDNTRKIFLKYQKKGVLHLIDEPEHNYNQSKWVDRMIRIAKKQYKADWVMNVDADEFWYSNHGNIKLSLPEPKQSNVLFVSALQIDAIEIGKNNFKVPKDISGYMSPNFKCMHTTKGYKHNVMGNHDVKMFPAQKRATMSLDITIFHFQMRSYQHYERKVVNGVEALDKNPKLQAGRHIRESFEIYKKGKLKDFYKKMMRGDPENPKYVKSDNRLYEYINSGYNSGNKILSEKGIYNGRKVTKSLLHSINRIPDRIRKKINKIKSK